MLLPPTGRQVTFTMMVIFRFADGKIVEAWWSYDMLGLMQQLTAPEWPLEGAWIATVPTPLGKNLLRHRMFLMRLQTMVKNRIHVLLDRHPHLRLQKPANRFFTQIGIAELKKIRLPKYDRSILYSEISLLEHLKAQIKQTNEWLTGGEIDALFRRAYFTKKEHPRP